MHHRLGIALEVLPRLGLTGVRQLGVTMGALNPEAAILFSLGVPMQDWPATAWSRGICGTDQVTDDGWDGHAVAYVSSANDGRDGWIVDPTASQFSQAGKGLKVGRLVATVPAELLAGEQISIFLPDGTMLRVVRNMALTHHLLSQTARDRIIKPLAEQVLARMTLASHSDRRSA